MSNGTIQIALIVQDLGGARFLKDFLVEAGEGRFEVTAVTGELELDALVGDNRCDLILLDQTLGSKVDAEAIQRISSLVPQVPLAVLGNSIDEASDEAARSAGAQSLLAIGHQDASAIASGILHCIDRKAAEESLMASERRLHSLTQSAADAIVSADSEGRIVSWNEGAALMFGYDENEILGCQLATLMPEEDRPAHFKRLAAAPGTGGSVKTGRRAIEIRARRKDGSIFPAEHTITTWEQNGRTFYTGILRDITERKKAEDLQRISSTVFEATTEAIMVTDAKNTIIAVNPAFSEITGYAADEVIGRDPGILNSGRHGKDFYNAMWQALQKDGKWQGEIWNRRKSGEVFPEWLTIAEIRNEKDVVVQYAAVFSDISKRKQDEETIRSLAYYDALTGLPNRSLLYDRLDQAIQRAERTGREVAILHIDLDRFKLVNDALGPTNADRLLQDLAARIAGSLRNEDTVARMGGDEFTIVLPDIHSERDAVGIARKLLSTLAEPLVVDGRDAFVTGSMGISLYPHDSVDVNTLLRNADAAMHRAKDRGRNNFQFFTIEMNQENQERINLESALRHALNRGELSVYYQPQVCRNSRKVIGAEALVRWDHPELGRISPDRFIPLAEETGLIDAIGEWVLRTACRQTRQWMDEGFGALRIAVNVSGHQFKSNGFVNMVRDVLDETGLPVEQLELEITESLLMDDVENAVQRLHALNDMGISLAIDDFGTGYSSLAYLKRFPVARLKIDRSFVMDVTTDPEDQAIISAIIAMGHALHLEVIGEGVETAGQIDYLTAIGCDTMQGYFFSPPRSAEDYHELVLGQTPADIIQFPAAQ